MRDNTSDNFLNSLLNTPELRGVEVSPDGAWVAWSWTNIGASTDVYLSRTDGTTSPQKITDFGQRTFIASWSGDSQSLVVFHDYDGDERFCFYQVFIDGKEKVLLTDEHPNYFIHGGQLSPDQSFLIYGANYDFVKNTEIEETYIYRHELKTGERIVLAKPQRANYSVSSLNKQGTQVIYNRSDEDPAGQQIWLVASDGTNDREILNFGPKIKVSASWHKTGDRIIFVVEEDKYRRVGLYHLSDARIEWILDDSSRNIESAYIPDRSNSAVILESVDAETRFSLLDLDHFTEEKFNQVKDFIPLAINGAGQWVGTITNSTQPEIVVVYDLLNNKIINKIFDVFDYVDYQITDLVKVENYHWLSSDGQTIQGWLYRSKDHPLGTIVSVHGGPTWHAEDTFDIDSQFFVSQGFNVLVPNYRGSTGFGLEFQNSIKIEGWGGKEQDDILTGIKSLIKDGIASAGKIGITGTSYGGYSAWFAITHFSTDYVMAAAPICGMTDLVVDYETTRPDLRNYSEEMMGGSPTQVPAIYHERSPINFIKNIKGRLLIIQGVKDPNVTLSNVAEAEKSLRENNIIYEKLVFADEGHGISKPKNQKILLSKLATFFKESF